MSAVAAYVDEQGGICLAGDGAACGEDGRLIGQVNKLFSLPHLNAVYAHVGLGAVGHLLLYEIGMRFTTFDELRDDFIFVLKEVRGRMRLSQMWSDKIRSTVLLGGWSDANQRFEMYKVHTLPKPVYEADGVLGEHEAWKLHPLDRGVWVSTLPGQEEQEACGLPDFSGPALDYVARWVSACRLECGREDATDYSVGCFMQMMVLNRTGVQSWIAHRWPDPMGERIDPARGDLLPALPLVPS